MDRMRKSKFTEEQIAMALRQGDRVGLGFARPAGEVLGVEWAGDTEDIGAGVGSVGDLDHVDFCPAARGAGDQVEPGRPRRLVGGQGQVPGVGESLHAHAGPGVWCEGGR